MSAAELEQAVLPQHRPPYNASMASFDALVRELARGPVPQFDGTLVYQWANEQRWVLPLASVALYIVVIFGAFPLLPAAKTPLAKHAFAAWNLLLSMFSAAGVAVCVPYMMRRISTRGLWDVVCNDEIMFAPPEDDPAAYGAVGYFLTLFMLSKIPELLDTVFLAWMNKPIMFLHWYHHCTVLLYCWFAFVNATPSATFFGTMNYCVHAVMYFYFALSGYTRRLSFLRLPITTMQLAQMVVGVSLTVAAYWWGKSERGCSRTYTDSWFYPLCGALYGSYVVLFAKLFVDSYVTKKRGRAPVKKNVSKLE